MEPPGGLGGNRGASIGTPLDVKLDLLDEKQ